jgi:hypothetical protein
MGSEIRMMPALASQTAECADPPAGAADDGAQVNRENVAMERGTNGGDGVEGLLWYGEVRPGICE